MNASEDPFAVDAQNPRPRAIRRYRSEEPPLEASADAPGIRVVVQWTTDDNTRFIPAARTCGTLPPGLYRISQNAGIGVYFESLAVKTEGLLRFPQVNSDKVIHEIEKFWERGDIFAQFGLTHKRGILLWGPPGSGKSSTIQLVMADVIRRGGVGLLFCYPTLFLEGFRKLRAIQPTTPVVVLMEDLDEILDTCNESEVLNILDGAERLDKVVFLASTNYPGNLGPRIVNRPSRFDKRFKIGVPNAESRAMYLEHLFRDHPGLRAMWPLAKWVEDTAGFSLAHLKELFTAVVILDDTYDEAIATLRTMREKIDESDGEDDINQMGFVPRNRSKRPERGDKLQ